MIGHGVERGRRVHRPRVIPDASAVDVVPAKIFQGLSFWGVLLFKRISPLGVRS